MPGPALMRLGIVSLTDANYKVMRLAEMSWPDVNSAVTFSSLQHQELQLSRQIKSAVTPLFTSVSIF